MAKTDSEGRKTRIKDVKMIERSPEGIRSHLAKKLEIVGSQLTIDPLTLVTRHVAKDFVAELCEKAIWDKAKDGFCFRVPSVSRQLQLIAKEARNVLGTKYATSIDKDDSKPIRSKVSFLTRTTKMGCYSFNLPAGPPEFGGACPASGPGFLYRTKKHPDYEYEDWEKFVPNPTKVSKQKWICNACYALKGNYAYTTNVVGQMIKFHLVKRMLSEGGWKGRDFASYAVEAIRFAQEKSREEMRRTPPPLLHHVPHPNYFRIHDAGDFFNEEYWDQWVAVMENLPDVNFWAPTRMWSLGKPMRYLSRGPVTGNLALRPSALHFGEKPPDLTSDGLAVGAGAAPPGHVPSSAWTCPAYEQEHVFGGSGPQAVVEGKGKKRTVLEGFYYCADASKSAQSWIKVPEDDLSACKTKGGKVSIRMEAGSCQRAHGPASPGLPKRYLPVVDAEDLPIRQGGHGCRACWDTSTSVYYHEH